MFHKFKNRLKMKGNLIAETALRIGGTRSIEPVGTDLPVVKDSYGRPYIPGSSFRGVLRSRIEQFIRGILSSKSGACIAINQNECCIDVKRINEIKKEFEDDEKELTKQIIKETCMVCQLFGSPWLASRI
ncbi:CRISPR-associated RAMP protein, partial [Candidatus Poribacteria bacterium]|nr:CRISPR-associated RAMP protein [Candidatus Poribacteria bacterium]